MELLPIKHLEERHLSQLHELYQTVWWGRGRTLSDIARAVAGSDYIFAFAEPISNQLVVFARVLSDRAYKALLLDVIIHPDYRQQGFGRMLMNAVLANPDLARVRHIELYCRPELIDFYRRFGFTNNLAETILMRRDSDNLPDPATPA